MDPSIVAVIVAVVGVVGTLAAPTLSSLTAGRLKRKELQMQSDSEHRNRQEELKHSFARERRDCYVGLNMSARAYQNSIRLHAYAVKFEQGNVDAAREGLADARKTYRSKYTEAQMIVSDDVLTASSDVNAILAEAYGMLRRMEEGRPLENENFDSLIRVLDSAWNPLAEMRSRMRKNLGVAGD